MQGDIKCEEKKYFELDKIRKNQGGSGHWAINYNDTKYLAAQIHGFTEFRLVSSKFVVS